MAAKGTPWFRLYSQLQSHPKLENLSAKLKVPKAQAAGHLVLLWCWVTDYAEDGNLEGFETAQIERAAHWEGRSGHLVRALAACRWLDGAPRRYFIHNWMDYAESYKRAESKKNQRSVSRDSSETVVGQSGDSPPERKGKERRREENKDTRSRAHTFSAEVEQVAAHYLATYPRRTAQARDKKTLSKINARLAEGYTPEQLCQAIDGNACSQWYRDKGQHYLELIVRDAPHVDRFIAEFEKRETDNAPNEVPKIPVPTAEEHAASVKAARQAMAGIGFADSQEQSV